MAKKTKKQEFKVVNCSNCYYKLDKSCGDPGDICKDWNPVALPSGFAQLDQTFGELFPLLDDEKVEFLNRYTFANMKKELKKAKFGVKTGDIVTVEVATVANYGRVVEVGKKGVKVKLLGNKRFVSSSGSSALTVKLSKFSEKEIDHILNLYLHDQGDREDIMDSLQHPSVDSLAEQFIILEKFFNNQIKKIRFTKVIRKGKKWFKTEDPFNLSKSETVEFLKESGLQYNEKTGCYYALQTRIKQLESGLNLFNFFMVIKVKEKLETPGEQEETTANEEIETEPPTNISLEEAGQGFLEKEDRAKEASKKRSVKEHVEASKAKEIKAKETKAVAKPAKVTPIAGDVAPESAGQLPKKKKGTKEKSVAVN